MGTEPTGTNTEGEAPDTGSVVETDEVTTTEDAEQGWTFWLPGGLAIGTTVGDGIFVFPGRGSA